MPGSLKDKSKQEKAPNLKAKLSIKDILAPIEDDLNKLEDRLINKISPDSRLLSGVVQEVFKAGGKRIRPAICFLVYRALLAHLETQKHIFKNETLSENQTNEKIFLTAELTELIHSASLVHDDIIDNSLVRRGLGTVNSKWNNAVTVISGDFMFARAAVNLGKLECNEVVQLYANVLDLLCDGEIEQVEHKFKTEIDWDYYLRKNYKKTASLIEAPAKAPASLLGLDESLKNSLAAYGSNLGAAFQIVDDILDYTSDEKTLGKPAGSDLKEGHLTAPVLFALEEFQSKNQEKYNELIQQIQDLAVYSNLEYVKTSETDKLFVDSETKTDKRFIESALTIIKSTSGIERSKSMANDFANTAIRSLGFLSDSIYKQSLIDLARYVVDRDF